MQTLHAISDLGLSIAKKSVPDQTDVPGSDMVPLPAPLYMNVEKNQDEHTVVSTFQRNSCLKFP